MCYLQSAPHSHGFCIRDTEGWLYCAILYAGLEHPRILVPAGLGVVGVSGNQSPADSEDNNGVGNACFQLHGLTHMCWQTRTSTRAKRDLIQCCISSFFSVPIPKFASLLSSFLILSLGLFHETSLGSWMLLPGPAAHQLHQKGLRWAGYQESICQHPALHGMFTNAMGWDWRSQDSTSAKDMKLTGMINLTDERSRSPENLNWKEQWTYSKKIQCNSCKSKVLKEETYNDRSEVKVT